MGRFSIFLAAMSKHGSPSSSLVLLHISVFACLCVHSCMQMGARGLHSARSAVRASARHTRRVSSNAHAHSIHIIHNPFQKNIDLYVGWQVWWLIAEPRDDFIVRKPHCSAFNSSASSHLQNGRKKKVTWRWRLPLCFYLSSQTFEDFFPLLPHLCVDMLHIASGEPSQV